MSLPIDRRTYAQMYGPTVGDRIRLADTNLLIEVERDLCAGGDEAVAGSTGAARSRSRLRMPQR